MGRAYSEHMANENVELNIRPVSRRNPYAEAARARKVLRLVAEIDRRVPSVTPGSVVTLLADVFTPANWLELAREAGCHAPSVETIAQVIGVYRERAADRVDLNIKPVSRRPSTEPCWLCDDTGYALTMDHDDVEPCICGAVP